MSVSHLSLFRRNKTWYIIYNDGERIRWKSTRESQKHLALKRLSEFEDLIKQRPQLKCLSTFMREFFDFAEGNYSKESLTIYRIALQHLQVITGDCPLSAITSKHIDMYKVLRLRDVCAVTVNIELERLRAFFNRAIRWKALESNPCNEVEFVEEEERMPAYFTKENFQKLFSVIKEAWLKDIIIFSASTGLRQGEAINLEWNNVDFDRKILTVESNCHFRTKKGKRRVVPMSDLVYELLVARFRKMESPLVFPLKGKCINSDYLTHKFKKYIRMAGLDDRLKWHSLRHSFASLLVQDGVSLYEVQKLLGHSSSKVTEIYSHLQPENMHSIVNKILIPIN